MISISAHSAHKSIELYWDVICHYHKIESEPKKFCRFLLKNSIIKEWEEEKRNEKQYECEERAMEQLVMYTQAIMRLNETERICDLLEIFENYENFFLKFINFWFYFLYDQVLNFESNGNL